jgi:hypothetical protein
MFLFMLGVGRFAFDLCPGPKLDPKIPGTSRAPAHYPGTFNASGRPTLKTITTLALAAFTVLPLAATPVMAQSNGAPSDQNVTGTQGGTVTTQSGKTVQAPPAPPPGSKGSDNGR